MWPWPLTQILRKLWSNLRECMGKGCMSFALKKNMHPSCLLMKGWQEIGLVLPWSLSLRHVIWPSQSSGRNVNSNGSAKWTKWWPRSTTLIMCTVTFVFQTSSPIVRSFSWLILTGVVKKARQHFLIPHFFQYYATPETMWWSPRQMISEYYRTRKKHSKDISNDYSIVYSCIVLA